MRVALVYPYRKLIGSGCEPPLSLLYLATSLQKRNSEVTVFDRDGFLDEREMIAMVVDSRPEVLGIPIFTRNLREAFIISQEFRRRLPNLIIIAGGPHPTACPDNTLNLIPEINFVLCGESDYTFCEVVEQLQSNVAYPKTAGLYYWSDGKIVLNQVGIAPQDLNMIPFPNRKLLWDNYKKGLYWRIGRKGVTDLMITSRGCPFNCKFCFKIERGYRFRSPENVVNELVYLASIGIKNVDFADDLFTLNKSRCIEICRLLRETGLKFDLKVRSRVDTIDDEMLAEMRKSGVRIVVYGFESGSQKVLNAMNKKTKVERNYEVVHMTKKAGLQCFADMFIGFPGETPETLAETEKFLLKARPTAVNMGILYPLPATQVYLEAKKNGSLIGDWSLDGFPYVKLPWMEDFSTIVKYYNKIIRRYYLNPFVIFSFLRYNLFKISPWQCLKTISYLKMKMGF